MRSRKWIRILAAVVATSTAAPAMAQGMSGCQLGQSIVDDSGRAGIVVGSRESLCLVKYKDGTVQSWVPLGSLKAGSSMSAGAESVKPVAPGVEPPVGVFGVTVLRPQELNRLVYRADALGHILLTARVNGAPVKFLVDTGATLVSLTPEDAEAAGLKRTDLSFDQTVYTGNGPVHAAVMQLRELRIDDLEIDNVQVAVIDSLKQSVLGMSFLRRLKEFDMRDGVLTLTW